MPMASLMEHSGANHKRFGRLVEMLTTIHFPFHLGNKSTIVFLDASTTARIWQYGIII